MVYLVVGDKGATFNEVMFTICESPVASQLMGNWKTLARELGVSHFNELRMNQSLLHGDETLYDILHDLLRQWISQNGSNATVQMLCEALETIQMNQIASELQSRFVLSPLLSSLRSLGGPVRFKPNMAKNEDLNIPGNFQAAAYMTQQVGASGIYYYPAKKRIGRGATSLVFHGYFEKVGKLAAVKEIKKKDSDIFDKELEAFKTLKSHPNVVGLFHWTEHNDMLYFAMEQATCDLRNLIEINPTLDRKAKLTISFGTANGLKFLHEYNILHRDIKPENILIFEKNEDVLAKLGDFGTSRKMTSLTSTLSSSKGTEVWMSPEAIIAMHDDEPFPNSKAIDIFSLGMTFYFTFSSGTHPFAKSQKYKCFLVMNIRDPDVKYIPLEEIDNHDNTTHLLDWMMQKSPKDRPDIDQVASHPMWTD